MKEWRDRYQLEFVKSAMEPSIRLWKHEGKWYSCQMTNSSENSYI